MPKMKSHRGAAKRFKLTASGKIRRRQPNRAHLLEKKSSRRTPVRLHLGHDSVPGVRTGLMLVPVLRRWRRR